VTRARLTQIMDLLLLAPDLQEQILELPRVTRGRDPVTEREIRAVAKLPCWRDQRRRFDLHYLSCLATVSGARSENKNASTRSLSCRDSLE
jgi:hypothetical protein